MIHQRLLGYSAVIDPASGDPDVDVGGILRRLLLFDTYILKSIRLREFPTIVERLGFDATIELLRSGALRIHLDALTVAQTGQLTVSEWRVRKGILPKGSYCFHDITIADRRTHISQCFRESIDPIRLAIKDRQKLKHAILESLESPPADIGKDTIDQLNNDLRAMNPALIMSVANQLKVQLGLDADPEKLFVRLRPLDNEDFETESNLEELFGLDLDQRHKVVERAVLDLSGVNQRIAEMKAFSALSGFRANDLPLFEEKVSFITGVMDPDSQEDRVKRVCEVANLPDFRDVGLAYKVDIGKFLELRNSRECREFRAWLPSIDQATDKQIREYVSDLKSRIAALANSISGRVLRFLTSTGLGLVPGAGIILAAGASVLDTFIVDRIFKESGIVTFVSRMYPALIEQTPK